MPQPLPPPEQQQQCMDDERAPKRAHESPFKPKQTEGATTSSNAWAVAAASNAASPMLEQPKKTVAQLTSRPRALRRPQWRDLSGSAPQVDAMSTTCMCAMFYEGFLPADAPTFV